MKQYYKISNGIKEKKKVRSNYKKNLSKNKLEKIQQIKWNQCNIHKIIKNNFINYNNLKIFLILSLMNYDFMLCTSILKYSEVSLKINGTGNIKILSDSFFQSYYLLIMFLTIYKQTYIISIILKIMKLK